MAKSNSKIRKNMIYVLAALVFVLSFILLYTQYSNLRNLKEQEAQEEIALEEARLKLALHMSHLEKADEYALRLDYAKQMIPEEASEDALLKYLTRTALEYNLFPAEVRFGPREENEHFVKMPFNLVAEGGFQEVRQFLKHLYGGERAVRVDEIRITRLEEGPYSTHVNLTAAAFYSAAAEKEESIEEEEEH